jgi:hypothetical protein
MNPRIQNRKVRIQSWLASLSSSPVSDIALEEPRAKCTSRDADVPDVTFAHTYNLSPTVMEQEHHENLSPYRTPKKAGRKRAADKMDVDDGADGMDWNSIPLLAINTDA